MIMSEQRRVARDRIDPDQVLTLLRRTELVGHGGGSFPTAIKLAAARDTRPILIINGCDGEPLVYKDVVLLSARPLLVADGIAVVQQIVRPRRTMIAVHAGSPSVAAAQALVAEGALDAELLLVPDRYVSSEASSLASLAAGGEARPLFRERPLTAGMPGRRGRPVLVLNAETVARIAAAVVSGAAMRTRLVTLAGEVSRPGLLEVGLDTRIGDLVDAAEPTRPPRAVLVGGYGGRWFDWAELGDQTIGGLGRAVGAGLIMVSAQGCPLATVGAIADYLADQSAGQCGPCMFGLPAIAADWRLLSHPAEAVAARERLRRRLPTISRRGACHHPDGAVGMVASALDVFGAHLNAHRRGHCSESRSRPADLLGARR